MIDMFAPDVQVVEVAAEYGWIWRAWHRLTHERQWQVRGMGMPMGGTIITPYPTAIPWTAVHMWADAQGYDEGDTLFLDAALIAMDGVFLAWWGEQQKTKS